MIKKDIDSAEDIKLMVDSFYDKVNKDEMLSYVFNDYAKVNWQSHLPKMYNFWGSMLLGEQSYKGNPFFPHISLPIEKKHFERWVSLFVKNIDEHFQGNTAENTKLRAKSIAHIFQSKLEFLNYKK